MIILSIFFLVTALIYSSVGFGGGSTYLALLLLWGIPYTIFPLIALACNIIVVSGNSFNYIRAGNFNLKLLLPYLFGSIPFAFIGGSIQIQKELFAVLNMKITKDSKSWINQMYLLKYIWTNRNFKFSKFFSPQIRSGRNS